jgi:hypothetical protein
MLKPVLKPKPTQSPIKFGRLKNIIIFVDNNFLTKNYNSGVRE